MPDTKAYDQSKMLDREIHEKSIVAIWVLDESGPDALAALNAYLEVFQRYAGLCHLVVVVNGNIQLAPDIVDALQTAELKTSIVRFHRTADESTAIRSGMQVASGEIIVLLPSYRQVDENAVIDMLDQLDRGFDYVASWRRPRIDSRPAVWASRFFNAITRRLTGVDLHDLNSGLRVFRRRVIDDMPFYGDMHRFLPVLADKRGFRVTETPVKHVRERVRRGDFRFGVFFRRFLDLLSLFFLCKFAQKPLRFFGMLGNFFLAAGGTVVVYMVIQRIFGVALSDRPALLLAVLLVVLGVQLFSVGLLGELIIFIHGRNDRDQYVETIHESSQPDRKKTAVNGYHAQQETQDSTTT